MPSSPSLDLPAADSRDTAASDSADSADSPSGADRRALEDARDQLDWNPDWSRRARGFATYAALRQLGRGGVADLVERSCRHARALTLGLAALPGAELVVAPVINQALVRFRDPRLTAGEADHGRRTDQVIERIAASGEALFTGARWRGQRVMRISVCNWRTTEQDVARAIAAATAAARSTA